MDKSVGKSCSEGIIQQTGGAIGPDTGFFRVAGMKGTLWTAGWGVWVDEGQGGA
jgi:hypothetical protein